MEKLLHLKSCTYFKILYFRLCLGFDARNTSQTKVTLKRANLLVAKTHDSWVHLEEANILIEIVPYLPVGVLFGFHL